ncbi:4-alpha-glucanotransferase [Persicirhabdus sediminis]|uniref:4-alpha-glucanotransferase n=1 Tax=Persicirhabdus sediminis TaxID=454144 RepID=A0A8J7SLK4_9BACT|nr:4-alpha-glucanotransferase [Persicirhabdus sediminis]MBK1792869.1 4-alpha-glucanotransferase [Persicirhabdus sediminis]
MSDLSRLRRAGVLIPVFSLRRSDSSPLAQLGIGDTAALREAIDWAAEHKVGFLQLLPINETGADSSPYNAISSCALDPVLLDLAAIPEITEQDAADLLAGESYAPSETKLVDYSRVGDLKWALLRQGFERFWKADANNQELAKFRQQEGVWLKEYCDFRWLMYLSENNERWDEWPEEYNTATKARIYLKKRHDSEPEVVDKALAFYAWIQWHAYTQWRDLHNYGSKLDVKLMGDVPIGISYYSSDVFFEPQWFEPEWFGGAPPETVFKDDPFACKWGQNWGIPAYRWNHMAEDNFSWWRRRIEKLTDVFHIFRIDHILGFYRIFSFPWHPSRNDEFLPLDHKEAEELTGGYLPKFLPHDDDTEYHRSINLKAGDRYLKMVLEAAGGSEVVGEDLGMVPDYVRPHLAKLGIAGFKICHWEMNWHGHCLSGKHYPECSFATFATHDHPSIPAMWRDWVDMAHSPDGNVRLGGIAGLRLVCEFAGMPTGENYHAYGKYNQLVKWAMLRALFKSKANYAAIMITDLLDSTERINIPGTVGGANWRYRMPWPIQQMPKEFREESRTLSRTIAKCKRSAAKPKRYQASKFAKFEEDE